jgi:tetratricopeptide (TPR) repeat protein
MDRSSELDQGKRLPSLQRTALPFVGRRQQLHWLERCLEEASAGQPRAVLIPGEAGIGKTRLLKEVQTTALRRGMQSCYGRCYADLALPYLPFIEPLLGQIARVPEEMVRPLGSDTQVIRQFLHRQRAALPATSALTSAPADQDKLRLLVAVTRLTIALAQRGTMLLIVDDLHWADPSSLELFGHLVFAAADTAMREPVPLLILGTYRPEELQTRLAGMLARLRREDICQVLDMPGLDEAEIRALLQGLGLMRPSQQLVTTISTATHGNPFFIQEVVHHMQQRGALQERGGYLVTSAAAADLQLPEHIMTALAARTQELSDAAQRLLTLAAFLGDDFSPQVLSAVSGTNEEGVLDVLDEGMQQQLLQSEAQTCRFAHPLIQQVFYTAPNAARRQRLHYQIAQALERLYANDLGAHVLEIAHHLIRAGAVAETDKVVHYARWAGDQAFAVCAWGEAARYYEAALSAAESTRSLPAQELAEIHYRAGLAHHRNQDVGPCLHRYEKAIEAYRRSHDQRGMAQVLMDKTELQYTLASVPLGTLADVQPLEALLNILGDREPGLCGQMSTIISLAYRNARQTAKAKEMAARALEIGQRLQDDRLCSRANTALALGYIQSLHVSEALQSWQSALESARRADDLLLQGWPLQRMPLALAVLGQFEAAQTVALEGCALIRQTHDWGEYSVALSHLTSIEVARGNFDMAERHAHEALLMMSRSGYPWGSARALLALACAYALRGAWTEAEDTLNRLVEPGYVFQEAGPIIHAFVRVFRQLVQTLSGRGSEALEPLVADLMPAVGSDTYSLAPCCALVELCDLTATPALVEQPAQALSRAMERGVLFSSGWMYLIPRVLGVAAALNGQWEKAADLFHAAIDAATRAGARPELGRSYLDLAHMLAARGRLSDRQRASEFVTQAGVIFHELGMRPFAQRTAQLVESLRMHLPLLGQPSVANPGRLNERETAILLRLTQARTNFLG